MKGYIRLAQLSDAMQIAQVHVQSWKETYPGVIKQEILDDLSVESRFKLWEILTQDPNHAIWVYVENDVVLGFLDGYLNPNNTVAELKAFYLLQHVQKQGIGQEMFQQFYSLVKLKHYTRICLEVFKQNPSRFFYEKMGAVVFDEINLPEYGEGVSELLYHWQLG